MRLTHLVLAMVLGMGFVGGTQVFAHGNHKTTTSTVNKKGKHHKGGKHHHKKHKKSSGATA